MGLGDAMDARTSGEDHYLEICADQGGAEGHVFLYDRASALILVLYMTIGITLERRGPQFQCWKTTCSPMWLLHPATFGSLSRM